MWGFLLLLLCLPPPGSAMPLPHTQKEPSRELQTPGPSLAHPATPPFLPTHSEAPTLLLNLGLNFQVKVLSQGKGQPQEGPGRATSRAALPPSQLAAPSPARGLAGTVGPQHAPAPTAGASSSSSSSAHAPPALWAPAHPLRPWEHSSQLQFQVDVDLTAGIGHERGPVLAGNGTSPQLPSLQAGIASQGGDMGLFGFMLPPEPWEPPEWNATGSPKEESGDPRPTAEWTLGPGPAESSGSPASSPGNEEAFADPPACPPARAELCGSPRPEPDLPLFVALHPDWSAALAAWGPAWEAHVYGAGALFALLALLALLGLLALPCRRRRPAAPEGRLLGLLHLLLLGAGGARAGLLLGEAEGRRRERLPALAARLLHDLPLPCLTSALATALLLLLSRRPRARLSARPAPARPCLLALLLLAHFSAAAGAVLAAALPPRLPLLLLASRGLFALLAALLSAALLARLCLARGEPAGQGRFASPRQWSRAGRAAVPAAAFGLLSAALHGYSVLHALGYGLSPALFGPWPWWALQMSCRLCEAGVGLPLASLGLCLSSCGSGAGGGSFLAPGAKPPPPGSLRWALSQPEKRAPREPAARRPSAYLPLSPSAPACAVLRLAAESGDPTADFQPPSPIDLRRSIDQALCSEGLLPDSGVLSAGSILSLGAAAAGDPEHAASCLELTLVQPQAGGEAPPPPGLSPASPGKGAVGSSLCGVSQQPLASGEHPGVAALLLRKEGGDACRPSDALSLGSETIDL